MCGFIFFGLTSCPRDIDSGCSQFAPWCSWCVKLAPTWEAYAEEVERELGDKLRVAKVSWLRDGVWERGLEYGVRSVAGWKGGRGIAMLIFPLDQPVSLEGGSPPW